MFLKTKLFLAGTTVVAGTCVGCYYYGQHNAAEQRLKDLEASNKAQQEYIEQLKAEGLRYEKFVNSVNNEVELILLTEEGITNTVVEKGSNFLTHTETEFSIEYRVKLGIKTENIHYSKRGNDITVIIDRDDIEVNSLEVLNKNILLHNAKLFSSIMTQDEKIAAEKLICEKAKEEVLNNKNIELAIDGFTEYMSRLADLAEVEINFIIQ